MRISAKTRNGILLVCGAGIFLWLFCVAFHPFEPRQPEPQYQGKKLTDWAREIDQADFFRQPRLKRHQIQSEQAIAAIRQIGTNALPVALELCGANDSWLKKQMEGWADRYNFSDWPDQPRFTIQIKSAAEKRFEGINIIWALGPVAKPAIPTLRDLLQSRNREVAEDAMDALPGVGTNAVPPLLELLNNPNEHVRLRAAIVLGTHFSSQAHAAVPLLLQCMEMESDDFNQIEHIRAIHTLGFINGDAPVIVPAIIRHIQGETNYLLAGNYFAALGNLGTNAKSSVPFLVRVLANPELPYDHPPKPSVMHALEKIDPKAAKPFFDQWKASVTNANTSTNALDLIRTPNPPMEHLEKTLLIRTNSP